MGANELDGSMHLPSISFFQSMCSGSCASSIRQTKQAAWPSGSSRSDEKLRHINSVFKYRRKNKVLWSLQCLGPSRGDWRRRASGVRERLVEEVAAR